MVGLISLRAGRTNSPIPDMPAGAIAIWMAKERDATNMRKIIPNQVTVATVPSPLWLNQFPQFRFRDNQWSSVTANWTQGFTDADGGTRASRLVGTGSWSVTPSSGGNLTLGTGVHNIAIRAKSNTGSTQTVLVDAGLGTGSSGVQVTLTTSWQRIIVPQTLSAGSHSGFRIRTDGADCDILVDKWQIYPPGAATTDQAYGWHMHLGMHAGVNEPMLASNVLDISTTNKYARAFADTDISLASWTIFACFEKTIATTGDRANIYSHTNGNIYGDIACGTDYTNGQAIGFKSFNHFGYRQMFTPGVQTMSFLNEGFNVFVWRYDAATDILSMFVDDVLVAGVITSQSAITNFSGLDLNDPFNTALGQWYGGALYDSALSRADIETATAHLKGNAEADGLTFQNQKNFLFVDGDSNSAGGYALTQGNYVATDGFAYPYLYRSQSSQTLFMVPFATNGHRLIDLEARLPIYQLALPTNQTGRRFVMLWTIGTNDITSFSGSPVGGAVGPYTVRELDWAADLQAEGFTTVSVSMPPRTDAAVDPTGETWRTTKNASLAGASEVDYFVDTSGNANIGQATSSDNTTYFSTDKVHFITAGQIENLDLAAPVLDALWVT